VLGISVSNVGRPRPRAPCSSPLTWNQVGLLQLGGTEKPTGQRTEAKTSQMGQDPCFVIGRSGACRHAPSRRRLERGGQTYATSITLCQMKNRSPPYIFSLNKLTAVIHSPTLSLSPS